MRRYLSSDAANAATDLENLVAPPNACQFHEIPDGDCSGGTKFCFIVLATRYGCAGLFR